MTDHPDNLERLLSERGDRVLTPAELSRLDELIGEDVRMAAIARQYDRLNVLLKGWRALPTTVDWADLSQRTRRTVASAGTAEAASLASVDRLLRDWAAPIPAVDWESLRRRISAAVEQEAALLKSRQQHRAARTSRLVVRHAGEADDQSSGRPPRPRGGPLGRGRGGRLVGLVAAGRTGAAIQRGRGQLRGRCLGGAP